MLNLSQYDPQIGYTVYWHHEICQDKCFVHHTVTDSQRSKHVHIVFKKWNCFAFHGMQEMNAVQGANKAASQQQ